MVKKISIMDLTKRLNELEYNFGLNELSAQELHDFVFHGLDPKIKVGKPGFVILDKNGKKIFESD